MFSKIEIINANNHHKIGEKIQRYQIFLNLVYFAIYYINYLVKLPKHMLITLCACFILLCILKLLKISNYEFFHLLL